MPKKGVYVPSLISGLGRVSFEANLFIKETPPTYAKYISSQLHFCPINHTFDLVKALTLFTFGPLMLPLGITTLYVYSFRVLVKSLDFVAYTSTPFSTIERCQSLNPIF